MYKWHEFKRWIYNLLADIGLLVGRCAGCGKGTTTFDSHFEWFVCEHCFSEDIAYNLAEDLVHPSNRFNYNN